MASRKRPDPVELGNNVVSIAAALENPADAPALALPGDQGPFGGRDDDDTLDRPRLPAESPVKALGVGIDARTCHYLSVLGQLVSLTPREHGKNDINLLFAPKSHLPVNYWPQWSEPKYEGRGDNKKLVRESEIVGFKQNDASEALINACGRAGIFDAQGRVRGRGAHLGAARALVLHAGDKIMVAGARVDGSRKAAEWHDPGVIGGFVYPASAAIARPHHDAVGEDAGERILALLQTWNWARPGLDAMLVLGWIGQMYVSGALDWRSHLLLTGGKGTGKSSLNGKGGVLDRLASGGVLRTGNASEAAVRQTLAAQTIPVIFDEFEPNEFNGQKMKAVIELARVASSGSEMHRGGQDHKAHEFVLRSAFLFSAILPPNLNAQDRSRFAVVELKPFTSHHVKPLDLDAAKLPALGRALMRRMVDGWPRLAATLRAYQAALAKVGHGARACDQFGTLLACADLLLYDHAPDAALLEHWARRCDPEGLSEIADAADEHEACLNHLSTTGVQARGGEERETIGAWIGEAVANVTAIGEGGSNPDRARKRLAQIGLAIANARPLATPDGQRQRWGARAHMPGHPAYLAIAQAHTEMAKLFAATHWQAGGWTTALGRAPGALRGVKVKFGRESLTATLVPLELVLDAAEIPGFGATPAGAASGPGPDDDGEDSA